MEPKPSGTKLEINLPGNMEAIELPHEVALYCNTCLHTIARFYATNPKKIKVEARKHAGGINLTDKLWTEADELNYQLGDYNDG